MAGEEGVWEVEAGGQAEATARARAGAGQGLSSGEAGGESEADPIGDGSQILAHHYVAAAMYRGQLADFLSNMFGLDRDVLLAKMNHLANKGAKKIVDKVAAGKPTYAASFLR